MKKRILSFVALLVIGCIPMLVVTAATFPYALETTDLTTGFNLVSTSVDTNTTIIQTWKIPSEDRFSAASLSVVKYDQAEDIDNAYSQLEAIAATVFPFVEGETRAQIRTFEVENTSITVAGANKALKLVITNTQSGLPSLRNVTIGASRGNFFVTGSSMLFGSSLGVAADLTTLLEAQMDKLPGGGGIPGFVMITAIFAIGTTVILLRKSRR